MIAHCLLLIDISPPMCAEIISICEPLLVSHLVQSIHSRVVWRERCQVQLNRRAQVSNRLHKEKEQAPHSTSFLYRDDVDLLPSSSENMCILSDTPRINKLRLHS